jgi:hypothetical protein
MRKIFFRLILLALVVPIVLSFFNESQFHRINSTLVFSTVANVIPAATRLGEFSNFPEFVKTVECVEWTLASTSFIVLITMLPFWGGRAGAAFLHRIVWKNEKIQWEILLAISSLALLVASDWGLPFISIYTGIGYSYPSSEALLFKAVNSSRLLFSTYAWALCGTEVVAYYLVAASFCTILAKAKEGFFFVIRRP